MIVYLPGYLCAQDAALYLNVTVDQVYRLAHRYAWRTVRRAGHREVYYLMEDIRASADREAA